MKVAITSESDVTPVVMEVFESAGVEVVKRACRTAEEVIETARDADGILVAIRPLTDRRILEALPKLKVICRNGVGVDSVDLEAATELGICVCNSPGVNTSEVADHAMALLLSITRQIPPLNEKVKAGAWSDRPGEMTRNRSDLKRIAGNTVGIAGFGNIGQAFASRIRGFGPARIIAHDPFTPQTVADLSGVQLVEFNELVEESDFISVHMPLTESTRHIFGRETFAKMKPTAVIVNTSRGPVIDESALAEALSTGQIAACGLDVTEVEPVDAESPLLNLPNLTITPHVAGASPVSGVEGSRRWAENAVRILNGQAPWGLANPDVVKRIAVLREQGGSRWEGVPEFRLSTGF